MVVNRSAPRATVVPILVYEDVGKAIDWLCSPSTSLRAGSLAALTFAWAARFARSAHRQSATR
jgi:hypothetical protein